MSGEAWLYLFAVLINAVNLFLQVFFTIMYSDLEWSVMVPFPALRRWQASLRRAICALELARDVVCSGSDILTSLRPQRLHQPDRSLQPPEHVHHSGSRCPRVFDFPLPHQRLLAACCHQPAPHRLER